MGCELDALVLINEYRKDRKKFFDETNVEKIDWTTFYDYGKQQELISTIQVCLCIAQNVIEHTTTTPVSVKESVNVVERLHGNVQVKDMGIVSAVAKRALANLRSHAYEIEHTCYGTGMVADDLESQ